VRIELNRVPEDFGIARLFARLSECPYRDQFILKGEQLFVPWADIPHRFTLYADFLSFGSPDPESLESIFNEVCESETTPPDGLGWLPGKVAAIREDNLFGGVRIKLIARLGNIRIPVQVDLGPSFIETHRSPPNFTQNSLETQLWSFQNSALQ